MSAKAVRGPSNKAVRDVGVDSEALAWTMAVRGTAVLPARAAELELARPRPARRRFEKHEAPVCFALLLPIGINADIPQR